MSTSFVVADRLTKISVAISGAELKAINEAADVLADLANAKTRVATGGDMLLSGVRKQGRTNPAAKLGVDVFKAKSKTNPVAKVQGGPPGLFTILEKGAKKHPIGWRGRGRGGIAVSLTTGRNERFTASGRRSSFRSKRKVFGIPPGSGYSGPKTGPFAAGGSRGHHPFTSALNIVGPKVPEIVQRETRRTITRAGFK